MIKVLANTIGLLLLGCSASVQAIDVEHQVPYCLEDNAIHDLPIQVIEVLTVVDGIASVDSGTAFLVEKDVWVTAAHVIKPNSTTIIVRNSDGTHINLDLSTVNRTTDIAILHGNSGEMVPMDTFIAGVHNTDLLFNIGYPGYAGETLRSFVGLATSTTINHGIVTTAFVTSGMSGGPTVRCNGMGDIQVVGVQVAYVVASDIRTVDVNNGVHRYVVSSNSGNSLIVPIDTVLDLIDNWTIQTAVD